MALYFILLLAVAAPADEPVIARDIHAAPVPLWQATKGLIDDRSPSLDYALPPAGEDDPGLDYDLTDMGDWGPEDRHEEAFEEAIDMAKQARQRIEAEAPELPRD